MVAQSDWEPMMTPTKGADFGLRGDRLAKTAFKVRWRANAYRARRLQWEGRDGGDAGRLDGGANRRLLLVRGLGARF